MTIWQNARICPVKVPSKQSSYFGTEYNTVDVRMCGMTYKKLLEYEAENQVEAEEEEGPEPEEPEEQDEEDEEDEEYREDDDMADIWGNNLSVMI